MDRKEIESLLPHRAPMLLVDEVHMEGANCISRYTIKEDEFFLKGHFPGHPIVPGVILCEIMAQGACLLLDHSNNTFLPIMAGIEKARFKNQVHPGDTVITKSRIIARKANILMIKSEASVEGNLCCMAEIKIAIIDP